MTPRMHAAFGVLASALVLFAIAWGFVIVGSPGTRRLERIDEQRLRDLQTIVREIRSMVTDWDEKKLKAPLPATLDEAAERARGESIPLRDPETGEAYGYAVKSETTFELCATFSLTRESNSNVFWNHPAGRHCFTIDVLDPPGW